MKIAILWRGPIRPDVEAVKNNMVLLKESIEKQGHSIDGYFMTWIHEDLASLIDFCPWLNTIAVTEMDKDLALSKLVTRCRTVSLPGHRWTPENNYKQFWATRIALEFIKNTDIGYDRVVLSRPDLTIDPGPIENWNGTGAYAMPSVAVYNGFNDQFAVGTVDSMLRVWDTADLRRLNALYGSSENPEEVLRKIAKINSVPTKFVDPVSYVIREQKFK